MRPWSQAGGARRRRARPRLDRTGAEASTRSVSSWARDAVFYHLYPLGALGAPTENDESSAPVPRLDGLHAWLDAIASLGATALLLGPVFESRTHGYDTIDYFSVDRRLGDRDALARLAEATRRRGLRLVLDGVFNHVGRDFWAFRDVRARGRASPYRDWFFLDFDRASARGDAFRYERWRGHEDLGQLDVRRAARRRHLFEAVRTWIELYDIDGLRLDAADQIDPAFLQDFAGFCRAIRPDFWLMGEVIHGDYRRWAGPDALDSVTNYELYKGLYSSHNDANYFELAHTLARQSGPEGRYAELPLYTFADNHDVDRIATRLTRPAHLYPLHVLLFTVPGVPSLYYGSEWGLEGRKGAATDAPLRPALTPGELRSRSPHPDLPGAVTALIRLRRSHAALRRGRYRPLHVAHRQLAFERATGDERIAVAVNAADRPVDLALGLPGAGDGALVDVLDGGARFPVRAGHAAITVPPCWGRILELRPGARPR